MLLAVSQVQYLPCSSSAMLLRYFKWKLSLRQNLRILNKRQLCSSESIQNKPKEVKFAQCKQRVFSGIQPTGVPHLGNYVGAISNWVQLQHQYDSIILSVVDLHSITIPQDAHVLRENILSMAACLIACGINPNHTILFQQSMVPYHTELSWILGCLCTLPRLSALPQWKEKSKKVKEPNIGLFTYPILQAADILLYKSTAVPVGEDQVTHLELARDLARAFNRNYGIVFPKPVPLTGDITKIRSLREPTNKMSKSEKNELSRIDLNDDPGLIQNKIKKSVTDSVSRHISYDPAGRPGISNLIDIHSSLSGLTTEQITENFSDVNTVEYKEKVAEVVNSKIQPISEEMKKLLADKHHLQTVLQSGAERASEIAEVTIKDVKQMVGLR